MRSQTAPLPTESIAFRILIVRGQRVMVDADLAELYGVQTKRLNEQVKRNSARFPDDLCFRLTRAEKLQVVANCDHLASLKYSSALPYAFTEHGAIQAANVRNSERAVAMSVLVVRTFVRLREAMQSHAELAAKLAELDTRVSRKLETHDQAIAGILDAIRRLMTVPATKKRKIGFLKEDEAGQ